MAPDRLGVADGEHVESRRQWGLGAAASRLGLPNQIVDDLRINPPEAVERAIENPLDSPEQLPRQPVPPDIRLAAVTADEFLPEWPPEWRDPFFIGGDDALYDFEHFQRSLDGF